MLTTGHIDTMGVTFSSNFNERHLEGWVGKFTTVGRGSHGYERRAISELGAVIVSDGPERMGKHLDIQGACFQAMRDEDMPVDDFPEFCLSHGAKPTRLDLCVNLHEAITTVDTLHTLAELGQTRTRATLDKRISSHHEDGFYVGSKKSDKFMRVYDKRLEQGLGAAPAWIRLEIQMRKRYAVAMTVLYAQVPNKRAFINRAIQDYCDFPTSDEIQEALRDQDGDLPLLRRKPPKFVRWLEKQVIPAMLNYQDNNQGVDVLRMFSLMYYEAQNQRKR